MPSTLGSLGALSAAGADAIGSHYQFGGGNPSSALLAAHPSPTTSPPTSAGAPQQHQQQQQRPVVLRSVLLIAMDDVDGPIIGDQQPERHFISREAFFDHFQPLLIPKSDLTKRLQWLHVPAQNILLLYYPDEVRDTCYDRFSLRFNLSYAFSTAPNFSFLPPEVVERELSPFVVSLTAMAEVLRDAEARHGYIAWALNEKRWRTSGAAAAAAAKAKTKAVGGGSGLPPPAPLTSSSALALGGGGGLLLASNGMANSAHPTGVFSSSAIVFGGTAGASGAPSAAVGGSQHNHNNNKSNNTNNSSNSSPSNAAGAAAPSILSATTGGGNALFGGGGGGMGGGGGGQQLYRIRDRAAVAKAEAATEEDGTPIRWTRLEALLQTLFRCLVSRGGGVVAFSRTHQFHIRPVPLRRGTAALPDRHIPFAVAVLSGRDVADVALSDVYGAIDGVRSVRGVGRALRLDTHTALEAIEYLVYSKYVKVIAPVAPDSCFVVTRQFLATVAADAAHPERLSMVAFVAARQLADGKGPYGKERETRRLKRQQQKQQQHNESAVAHSHSHQPHRQQSSLGGLPLATSQSRERHQASAGKDAPPKTPHFPLSSHSPSHPPHPNHPLPAAAAVAGDEALGFLSDYSAVGGGGGRRLKKKEKSIDAFSPIAPPDEVTHSAALLKFISLFQYRTVAEAQRMMAGGVGGGAGGGHRRQQRDGERGGGSPSRSGLCHHSRHQASSSSPSSFLYPSLPSSADVVYTSPFAHLYGGWCDRAVRAAVEYAVLMGWLEHAGWATTSEAPVADADADADAHADDGSGSEDNVRGTEGADGDARGEGAGPASAPPSIPWGGGGGAGGTTAVAGPSTGTAPPAPSVSAIAREAPTPRAPQPQAPPITQIDT